MELTLLTVADCPNAEVLAERLAAAGADREQVTWTTVADAEQAAALGMHGSPTLLIDGLDPFAVPGAATGYACRLYPGADGKTEGAPSTAALAAVLARYTMHAPSTVTLQVAGMSCANCQRAVEGAASAVPGVGAATADLTAGTATVSYLAIEESGYQVTAGAGA